MAPLPPSNTRRYFIDYATANLQHTMMIRTTNAVADADISSVMDDFFTALAPIMYSINIVALRVALEGSDVTNPGAWGGGSSYAAGAEPLVFRPRQMCFLGRSSDGRRARLFVYGGEFNTPDDFRLARTASTAIDDAYTVLETHPGVFLSISKLATFKYSYVDINFNSYWERKVRP